MRSDDSVPSYQTVFGRIDFRRSELDRSVYSPAAYLADLLDLLSREFVRLPLRERRPDLWRIPLDAAHTSTAAPYIDIVNDVVAAALGTDPQEVLRTTRTRADLPLDLSAASFAAHLRRSGLRADSLYSDFTPEPDPDLVARAYLWMSESDRAAVLDARPDLLPAGDLSDVEVFVQASAVTEDELTDLLYAGLGKTAIDPATGADERTAAAAFFVNQDAAPVTLDPDGSRLVVSGTAADAPAGWFDRALRLVRLARRTGLPIPDLDLVLRSCCGNRLDDAAIRVIAAVRRLAELLDQPVNVVASLLTPISTLGVGDGDQPTDLFDRLFNAGYADIERAVVPGPAFVPPRYREYAVLRCTGDLLAPQNRAYRGRIARGLGLTDAELRTAVGRYRKRYGTAASPFDRGGIGPAELSLLHRVAVLRSALAIGVDEFFDVLDVLDADPVVRVRTGLPVLVELPGPTADCYRVLDGGDVAGALWLVQVLVAVVRWAQDSDLTGRTLGAIVGGRPSAEPGGTAAAVAAGVRERFEPVAFGPTVLAGDRFGERSARVLHGALAADPAVAAPADRRVLRHDRDPLPAAAHTALAALAAVAPEDLMGLGLEDRLAAEIYTGLVAGGYLDPTGLLVESQLPAGADRLVLARDFSARRAAVFDLVRAAVLAATTTDPMTEVVEPAGAVYPSDIATLDGLTAAEQAELYDHLVFTDWLDQDGAVRSPAFFLDPDNAALFSLAVDLTGVVGPVLQRMRAEIPRFEREPLALDPAAFAALGLTDAETDALGQSLRFNGVLDDAGRFQDKDALLRMDADELGLAPQFHTRRRAVLAALKEQVEIFRAALWTFSAESFREVAARFVAGQLLDELDGYWLDGARVPEQLRAALLNADDAAVPDVPRLRAADRPVLLARFAGIVGEQQPYRLDRRPLAALTFDAAEIDGLVEVLVGAGRLTTGLMVPLEQVGWFTDVHNATAFTVAGFDDYAKEVFFLLHDIAVQTDAAVGEITAVLSTAATAQRAALFGALQDACQVPADVAEAITAGVLGASDPVESLVLPVLAGPGEPADAGFRAAVRRIAEFALLAGPVGLDPAGVAVAFADQDLAGKFPEPLVLPPAVDRIDALLADRDGTLLLFSGPRCWTYAASTRELVVAPGAPEGALPADGVELRVLSERFAVVAAVDAAFTDAAGAQWLLGHDTDGAPLTFVREPGSARWAPRTQVWGRVRNAFADPQRVAAPFVDRSGRTYLFCADQYVRYSGPDYTVVDEGYPRTVAGWTGEGMAAPGTAAPDAVLVGRDDRTYLFAGDRFTCAEDAAPAQPIAPVWGRVRHELAGADRVDAGFLLDGSPVLLRGDQLVRFPDALENAGLCAEEGFPQRIGTRFPGVPAGFESGVEAALVDGAGVVHLFKAGRVAALAPDGARVTPTVQGWGVLAEALVDGRVDTGFVGLDGRTYLFSGNRYVRYSGDGYGQVDPGYPRSVAGDWGGLTTVTAAVVLDGRTYLFGAAADTAGAPVDSFVRYSTRDYRVPDTGFPQPVADNWWNLPPALLADDSPFPAVDAVWGAPDGRTVLFSGDRFVVSDSLHRWWSQPRRLAEHWPGFPFDAVDAAFTGVDGHSYLFRGDRYVRFPVAAGARVEDVRTEELVPRPTRATWGRVDNRIARTGRVDATLVMDATETVDGVTATHTYTYLFSGDQYVRYADHDYTAVQDGYPRPVAALATEPRLANLRADLSGGVDVAFADRHTVVLVSGATLHLVTDALYRSYPDLPLSGVRCAFVEDGAVLVEDARGWWRCSALDGTRVATAPARPRALRAAAEEFRAKVDAVLLGVDANTYVFAGDRVFDVDLQRAAPVALDWGRPRNNVYHANTVDAVFVGVDKRTYVFSGDQFVVYANGRYLDAEIEGEPGPIAEHWAGLTSVTLAYVRDGRTHLYERPDPDGNRRCVTYSGSDYSRPDGPPQVVGPDPLDLPDHVRQGGFGAAAVLFEGENLLVLGTGPDGPAVAVLHEPTGTWYPPRPLGRIWRPVGELPALDELVTAFTGLDGAAYFFGRHEFTRYDQAGFSALRTIRDAWGRAHNNFLGADGRGTVDAAFVHRGTTTYLFSGDQYVRYSGADYRFTDPGYPRPLIGQLRREVPFAGLPESFDDVLADRIAAGAPAVVDAVVGNDRTVYLFVGDTCHAASVAAEGSLDLAALGRVRNTIAERGRVDAALATGTADYLFSADQYVRYSGPDHAVVDEGYPRAIETSLAADLGLAALPELARDGVDAVLAGSDGQLYLFRGPRFARAGNGAPEPINGTWGRVGNAFLPDGVERPNRVDAAFVEPDGRLCVVRGDQYARYRPGEPDCVEEGYPRPLRHDWALPDFGDGIDAGFVLDGRTYLFSLDQYVRYSDPEHRAVDRLFPQPVRRRWADTVDYQIGDVHVITRFARLAGARGADGAELAALLTTGAAAVEDPYARLAALLGWDADELRWLRRRGAFLPAPSAFEDRFELEFLLRVADQFAAADAAGTIPSRLHTDVVAPRWGTDPAGVGAAADALHALLLGRLSPAERDPVARAVHDELAVLLRDAQVSALIAVEGTLTTARDLFERYLIDVSSGTEVESSRVREAIAAAQLWVHRYLLGLESPGVLDGQDPADVRARIKGYWSWMRTYPVWAANRKVFCYPENYLRPELRATKTPAFATLENDLRQTEITADSAQRAFRSYLDEYTEVSRLAIAGGQVYHPDGQDGADRNLVLFGRTRSAPPRYYYRQAEFRDGAGLSATWTPWSKVDVQITAPKVYPVYAFGRVFVFWADVEAVIDPAPPSAGGTPPAARHRVTVSYSYYDLSGTWVSAQPLGKGADELGEIGAVNLFVQRSEPTADDPDAPRRILVDLDYTVSREPGPPTLRFVLTPELTAQREPGTAFAGGGAALFAGLFDEPPIEESAVVLFNSATDSVDPPWFGFDHKGGSFLCRPRATAAPPLVAALPPIDPVPPLPPLPPLSRVDAGAELPDGSTVWFDSGAGRYLVVDAAGARGPEGPIGERWGRVRGALGEIGQVDAVLVRLGGVFVISGAQYVRCSVTDLGRAEPGYPRLLADNDDRLPHWDRVDAAFTGPDGVEYFFSTARGGVSTSADPDTARPVDEVWTLPPDPADGGGFGPGGIDAAFVIGPHTFLCSGDQYVRYTGANRTAADAGYPRSLADNDDGLPRRPRIDAAATLLGATWFFDNATQTYQVSEPGHQPRGGQTRELGVPALTAITAASRVDAAYVTDGRLFLVCGTEFVRYTLGADGTVPDHVDVGYPRQASNPLDGVFVRDGVLQAFCGQYVGTIPPGAGPDELAGLLPIRNSWTNLPAWALSGVYAVVDTAKTLYLFGGGEYAEYRGRPGAGPVPTRTLAYELVRLTTGTAATLNQRLLAGGVSGLLDTTTQETDEQPGFSAVTSDQNTIRYRPARVSADRLPAGTHLDFDSANGIYYWEVFFHAPLLIAAALADGQRFDEARRWHEYVFDPTAPGQYWRFLPFVGLDVRALITACRAGLDELAAAVKDLTALADLVALLAALEPLVPVFQQVRAGTKEDWAVLLGITQDRLDAIDAALVALRLGRRPAVAAVRDRLREDAALLAGLQRGYDLLGDHEALVRAYLDDPFDPHAIAALRPVAYRRAVVMSYVDAVLGWGDMLFRQYTPDSVDEARMLYVLAQDLLGERPSAVGTRVLLPPRTAGELEAAEPAGASYDADLVDELTGSGVLVAGSGAVHAGVADPYFVIPPNDSLLACWDRVADRLAKIRQALTIDGVAAPLPLFAPPADPLALVAAAAAGAGTDAAFGAVAQVPHYRFAALILRAQELVDRLRFFGGDLLGALERRDGEQLSLLLTRQEGVVLGLTRAVRLADVDAAQRAVEELGHARNVARMREQHYQGLLDVGRLPAEDAQISLIALATAANAVAAGLKITAGVLHLAPELAIGPLPTLFDGGEEIGTAGDKFAEAAQFVGQTFSTLGELSGLEAVYRRTQQDWTLQRDTAREEGQQIDNQSAAAAARLTATRAELAALDQQIANNAAVATFMTTKFTSPQLYSWLVERLSAVYYQGFELAYETGRAAEAAFRFERGLTESEVSILRPAYWDGRHGGLTAAETLAVDLDRLQNTYANRDTRRLEIVRAVSLADRDPLALLRLKGGGTCEFDLTEAMFDRDFPGHYRRQVRTVSVTFVGADGRATTVPSMLTQLANTTVLAPDPKAVRYLLEPNGPAPETVRSDWRPGQQIALSQVTDYQENNGMFETRYDDQRYLPFEGTGAVSRWRLEVPGARPSGLLDGIQDVVMTLRYAADSGGAAFAAAVSGALRPSAAGRLFDVAVDFPEQWADFLSGDGRELVLPITPDRLPGITGRQITGMYAAYQPAGTDAVFLVDGDPDFPLRDRTLVATAGVAAGGSGVRLVLEGAAQVGNVTLVVTYRADR